MPNFRFGCLGPARIVSSLLLATITSAACRGGGTPSGSGGGSAESGGAVGSGGDFAGTGGASGDGAGGRGTGGENAGGATPLVDAGALDVGDGTAGAPAFTRAALLEAFGTCAAAAAKDFSGRAAALDSAAATLASAPSAGARAVAREAFHSAMDAWQVVELMQFGPTGRTTVLGGKDFRDNIYAWPLFSRCAIEEEIVKRGDESTTFGTTVLANRRGLGAVEYLLFYEGADTACPASSAAYGPWNALSTAEKEARKLAYAARAVRDIAERAAALAAAWAPDGGNFPHTLRTAGSGNAVYATTQAAINSITNAAFYIESEVKDMKLAGPLGVDMMACASDICPALLESKFARRSKANIAANLEGLRRLLEGCGPSHAGLGFDDLLTALGAGALTEALRARAVTAQAALANIGEPDLDVALVADKPSVRALYDAVKAVTDLLKTEFATVLDIELPGDIGTDND